MADYDEAGTCNSKLAVSLLVLEDEAELKSLARAGWVKPIGPDRWRTAAIVQGRIKQLLALATTYNAGQMAGALALTDQRVRQLTAEGRLKTVAKNKYDRDATTRDYVIWLRDLNRLANTSTSESRVREARAAEIEIRTAERTRRLITLDEALESTAIVCGLVRTEFGALPARFTRDLVLRREIEKVVNDSLARIAARLDEEAAALAAGRAADEPSRMMTPDQWAAGNRSYPLSAPIPGPRDPSLTPYMIAPGRAAAACERKRIVIVTAAQSGKTEMVLDLAGQRLDQKPAPILYVGPNKQFLTEQFEPRIMAMLDEAPSLAGKVARGKRMTKTRKVIAGVPLRLAHAGSSAALKSDPAALALVDEYDEMIANIRGQGDPLGLVERRGDTYPDFVAVVTSTCRVGMVETERDERSGLMFWARAASEDIESPIWRLWQEGTRYHWAWPCPHCSEYFIPRFDCLRFPENTRPTVAARETYLQCPRCGGVIEERHKGEMNGRGRYVAPGQGIDRDGTVHGDPPEAAALSFWVSGLASPFVTFADRVLAYVEAVAAGDEAMVQTAVTAGFGELYAPGGRDLKEWQQVARRRAFHRSGEVPDEAVRISAAVDVQKTGLYYSIRGWGARASSWQIESGELAGYTNEPEVWSDLANVLLSTYGGMHVALALVDSGFRPDKPGEGPTNVVYDFCSRFRRFVKPTKGYTTLAAPIMRGKGKVTVPGRGLAVTLDLVRLDTDFWKSRLHERLAWPVDQPGGFWLSSDATDDYCRQLVSEVRKLTPSGKAQWILVSRRNHFLDCEAMNEAAGHLLAAQKIPLGARRARTREPGDDSPSPLSPPAERAVDPRTLMANMAARFNRP